MVCVRLIKFGRDHTQHIIWQRCGKWKRSCSRMAGMWKMKTLIYLLARASSLVACEQDWRPRVCTFYFCNFWLLVCWVRLFYALVLFFPYSFVNEIGMDGVDCRNDVHKQRQMFALSLVRTAPYPRLCFTMKKIWKMVSERTEKGQQNFASQVSGWGRRSRQINLVILSAWWRQMWCSLCVRSFVVYFNRQNIIFAVYWMGGHFVVQ